MHNMARHNKTGTSGLRLPATFIVSLHWPVAAFRNLPNLAGAAAVEPCRASYGGVRFYPGTTFVKLQSNTANTFLHNSLAYAI
jgi:hypothetical protein